jgi:hypothetical protein
LKISQRSLLADPNGELSPTLERLLDSGQRLYGEQRPSRLVADGNQSAKRRSFSSITRFSR